MSFGFLNFPNCKRCGVQMIPIRFEETEYKVYDGIRIKTGRYRIAVSHLECPECLSRAVVDDSFDGPWYEK